MRLWLALSDGGSTAAADSNGSERSGGGGSPLLYPLSPTVSAGPSPRGPVVLGVPVGSPAAPGLHTTSGTAAATWQGHSPPAFTPVGPCQTLERLQEQQQPISGSPPVMQLAVKPGLAATEAGWEQQYRQYQQQAMASHLLDHLSDAASSVASASSLRWQRECLVGSNGAHPDPTIRTISSNSCSRLREMGIAIPAAQPHAGKLPPSGAAGGSQQQLHIATLAACAAAQAGTASRNSSSAILISKLETAVSVPLPGSPHRLSVSSSRGLGALRALKARLAAGRRRTSSSGGPQD